MPSWEIILDILIMLAAALVLGTLAEWARQSAILGYLVAGTLVGPNVFGLVKQGAHVEAIAELGVALLLFTIGLEFSFRRLRRLGRVALAGGTAQVLVSTLVGAGVALALGVEGRAALALGAMVALSSTACVVRLLVDRGQLDSMYGRNALGILLFQDVAVIPLMLLVVVLARRGGFLDAAEVLGRTIAFGGFLVVGFMLLFNYVVPRVLNSELLARNRELPIILAIIMALGSAYAAHAAGLSPAMGALIAGVLLGESPFATQIRADVGSLRTLLVTLFFASIGMLGDPVWVLGHLHLVVATVLMIMVGKIVIIWAIVRSFRYSDGISVGTGLCIAQVGEFSFVLAEIARSRDLIGADIFNLMVSATIVTLFLTPFCVPAAPRVARLVESLRRRYAEAAPAAEAGERGPPVAILVIGFGPAGQAVAQALYSQHKDNTTVVELSPRTAAVAREWGLRVYLGDAMHRDVLERAGVNEASVIAITLPDPIATRAIIQLCHAIAPSAAIVARSRYHMRRWELAFAGARDVVDEEEQVGLRIAAIARRYLHPESAAPEADHEGAPDSQRPE
jgi:CPA2 family monovalent cation:H+ antiporter-2